MTRRRFKTDLSRAGLLLALSLLLLGSACAPDPVGQGNYLLRFSMPVEVNADQEFQISLVVSNTGEAAFPGDDSFGGRMNLWEQSANPRSRAEALELNAIQSGESVSVLTWRGVLTPGVYILTWGSPEYGGSVKVFSALESDGRLQLGVSQAFDTPAVSHEVEIARAGSVEAVTVLEDGTLVVQGETSVSDMECVYPLLFRVEDPENWTVAGYPTGMCAPIAEGRWTLQVPADPEVPAIDLQPDTGYRVILLSEDPTVPPSEPFDIFISPPPQEE